MMKVPIFRLGGRTSGWVSIKHHRFSLQKRGLSFPSTFGLGQSSAGVDAASARVQGIAAGTNLSEIPVESPTTTILGEAPWGDLTHFVANASEPVLTACTGLVVAFVGGVAYSRWYKGNVLRKIRKAFRPNHSPVVSLMARSLHKRGHENQDKIRAFCMRRTKRDEVDKIIHGEDQGRYFMFLGSKGAGKTTMILDAMGRNQAEGVTICEAHSDLEIFRLRLGKALNYQYNEDSQISLFNRRDPREGGPRLDIERALNMLEKVGLNMHEKRGKPLVLIFNDIHVFQNTEDARLLLLQLQQRAETWAESGIITVVFASDEFWPYPLLRKTSNRMQILSISDLNPEEALEALKEWRQDSMGEVEPDNILKQALAITGGRLSFISRISRAKDIVREAKHMLENEKTWLLSQVGLIPDCRDDVLDEQKVALSTWLLLREFVRLRRKLEAEHKLAQGAGLPTLDYSRVLMPQIPYWRCRQIMTRADLIELLDQQNIIAVDINHDVTMDSMIMLKAAMEVVEEEGFDEKLQSVQNRIYDSEGRIVRSTVM